MFWPTSDIRLRRRGHLISGNSLVALSLAAVVLSSGCVPFDRAYGDCVDSGRCVDDGGLPPGGSEDAGVSTDAGSNGGTEDGGLGDGGCVPAPISSLCTGSPWCEVYQAPADDAGTVELNAVFGFSPTDVWVGGSRGFVAHWDGCRWSEQRLEGEPTIHSIWGVEPSVIWFGGGIGLPDENDDPMLALRRLNPNGAFTKHDPTARGRLYGISGSSGIDVWFVGGRHAFNVIRPTVLHWDGGSLRMLDPFDDAFPAYHMPLHDVWSTGPGEAWMAGSSGQVWRREGGSFKQAVESGHWFTTWAPTPDDVWLAGDQGKMMHGDGGTSFSSVPSGTTARIARIRGPDATRAWGVGDNGTVAELRDGAWTAATFAPYSDFRSLWAPSLDEVWIVTADGKVLHNRR